MSASVLLPRRALVGRLERALEARLVRIVASAGSGKSTLVRLAAARSRREVVTVPLDHRSCDASFFFWQLLDALDLARDELLPGRATPMETVHAIADELAGRPACVVAFDDAEWLREARPVLDIVARLARRVPAGTSVLLVSREPLTLSLEAGEDRVDLDEDDLALGVDEVAELLGRLAPGRVPPARMGEVLERTRGRVLLARLFGLACRREAPEALLSAIEASETPVLPLLDAALADVPPDLVGALERVSVLEALLPEAAAELAGAEVPLDALVEAAAERGLVDAASEPAVFQRSVRDARRARVRRRAGAWEAAHRRAADALRRARDPERALHHVIEAGDVEEAVGVLIHEGLAVITFNRLTALSRLLDRLPPELVDADPVLRFVRGTVRIVRMEVESAKRDLRAAAAAPGAPPDVADAARVRLGLTAMFQGDFAASIRENEIVCRRRSAEDPLGILSHANLELALRTVGREAEADAVAERIDASPVEFPDRLPVPGARCFIARLRGDFDAQRTLAMQGAAAARAHHAPGGLCFLLLHVAEGCVGAGRAEEGLEVADEAVSICRSMREHWWELVSRGARLRALAALGRSDEARREAREILAAGSASGGLHWTEAEAALLLADLPGEAPADALAAAWDRARRTDHPALRAEVRLGRARFALGEGRAADAKVELAEAERELGSVDARELRSALALARARALLALGRRRAAHECLAGALRDGPALRSERAALLPSLVTLALRGDPVARAQVVEAGVEALPHLARRRGATAEELREEVLDARASPLDVSSLGALRIARRGRGGASDVPVELSRPRLGELFRTLLARSEGGGWVASDVLLDALWRDVPVAQARRSLHTHLSWLRRSLEPDLPPRVRSRYLLRHEGSYRLELRGGVWDVAVFREELGAGLRAFHAGDVARADALLASALPRYQGPLFRDHPYDEALAQERAELARLFAEGSLVAARVSLQMGKSGAARAVLERLLAEDEGREEAWVALMEATAAAGRAEEVAAVLARCRGALARALDASPSPETVALAARLRGAPGVAGRVR